MTASWTHASRLIALSSLLAGAQLACGCGTSDKYEPVTVTGLEEAVAVASGARHSCAILKNGNTGCWGSNDLGQLGTVTEDTAVRSPTWVPLDATPVALAAGPWHTCALFDDKTVQCWGDNTLGALGVEPSSCKGSMGASTSVGSCLSPPSRVPGLDAIGAIAAGGAATRDYSSSSQGPTALAFSCAIRDADTVQCWGVNGSGQLGSDFDAALRTEPKQVLDINGFPLRKITRIAAGEAHACALSADGDVWCWGSNSQGQSKSSKGAVRIEGVSGAIDVAAGGMHSCAALDTGEVMCWGWNLNGQSSTSTDENVGVTKVSGVAGAKAVVAGARHTCALTTEDHAVCWGSNEHGQLGAEYGYLATPPVYAQLGARVIGLTAGEAHTCFLLDGGEIRCTGSNSYGQLGVSAE